MIEYSSLQVVLAIMPSLARGFLITLQVTFAGGLFGILVGIVLGTIQCNRLKIPVVHRVVDLYIGVIRGTPLIVQAFLVYYVVPDLLNINMTPLIAGIVTLSGNSAAYVAEIVRAGINALHRGQWEACFVLGYDKRTILLSIILPQTLRNVLPSLTNEITTLLKETSILGLIGIEEITRMGMNLNSRLMEPVLIYVMMALFYLVVTTILSGISRYLEVDHS